MFRSLSLAPSRSLQSLFLLLSSLFVLANAACDRFSPASGLLRGAPNDQIYTTSAIVSYIVSPIVNCSGSALGIDASNTLRCNATQCGLAVPQNYLVNITSELNITATANEKRDILALVKRNTSMIAGNALYDFNSSMTVTVGGATCIPEGTAKWWSFTPVLTCAEGTLSDCSGSDSPSNGTPIRACGVRYFAINNNGIGIPVQGPNIVTGGGFESRPAPPNATIIDNSQKTNSASVLLTRTWAWLAFVAVLSFQTL